MSPLVAYFLGLITILIVLVPFWYLAKINGKIQPVYNSIFCNGTGGSV